jgi:hypothetical protein
MRFQSVMPYNSYEALSDPSAISRRTPDGSR